jgi:uncharacterized protein with ParB-like and HNH nuclease domain
MVSGDISAFSNSLIPSYTRTLASDYFEIERLIEDLAKLYSRSYSTSWLKWKVSGIQREMNSGNGRIHALY